jgi:uncharacterized protein (DUF2141 family)
MKHIWLLLAAGILIVACKKQEPAVVPDEEPTEVPDTTATDTTQPMTFSTLHLEITELATDAGTMNIAIYNSEQDFDASANAFVATGIPVSGFILTTAFDSLPAGVYAVALYHDENNNGQLDENLFGIPTEGFGFSNNAMGTFGPPSFSQASFPVDGENDVHQQIELNQF